MDDELGKLVDAHAGPVADVVGAMNVGVKGDVGKGRSDVSDMDEVAGLLAVAKDGDGLAGEGFFHEDRHCGGVSAFRILARAEDVEEAEGGGLELTFAVEHLEVVFAVELGDGVGALWLGEHCFDFRDDGVVSVDRGRAGENEFFDSRRGGRFEHVEEAGDVDLGALVGF